MAKKPAKRELFTAAPGTTFCRQTNGIVRITLNGTALQLEGFGYPRGGGAMHYETLPPVITPHPTASDGLSAVVPFTVDPDVGTWSCTLLDSCSTGSTTPRDVVIWYRYESNYDVYWMIEVLPITIPDCDDTVNLPNCTP